MEEEANQLYRRPRMTGQARDEEDYIVVILIIILLVFPIQLVHIFHTCMPSYTVNSYFYTRRAFTRSRDLT